MSIKKEPTGKWNIKETEFIIRLLKSSMIPGDDMEQALSLLKKFKLLHESLLKYEGLL